MLERCVSVFSLLILLVTGGLIASVSPMLITQTVQHGTTEDRHAETTAPVTYVSSYQVHSPIAIYGDSGFVAQGWPGRGTPTDPYRIEGLLIASDTDCIKIYSTTVYFVIRNCILRSVTGPSGSGLIVQSVAHAAVVNVTVENKGDGIWVSSSTDVSVTNCTVRNAWNGIYVGGTGSCDVSHNRLLDCRGSGIRLQGTGSASIFSHNTIADSRYMGMWMDSAKSSVIVNNTIQRSAKHGVYMYNCDGLTIVNNTVSLSGKNGIDAYESDDCLLKGNHLVDNNVCGYLNNRGDRCTLEDNHVSRNGDYGIYLYYSETCTVRGNLFEHDGLVVGGSDLSHWSHSVLSNTVNGKSLGYFLSQSGVMVNGGDYGQILAANCSDLTVSGMSGEDADIDVTFIMSQRCSLVESSLSGGLMGVYLASSVNCGVVDTSMTDCGIVIAGGLPEYWVHSFSGSSVNGKPIAYLDGATNLTINGTNYGQVFMLNCSGITVRDGIFQSASMAIASAFSHDIRIVNNSMADCTYGIYMRSCIASLAFNNTVTGRTSYGIRLYSCNDCEVVESRVRAGLGVSLSTCSNCTLVGVSVAQCEYGVYISSSSTIHILNTYACLNEYGLYAYGVSDLVVDGCTFEENTLDGAMLRSCNYARITNSKFCCNAQDGLYLTYSNWAHILNSSFSANGMDGLFLQDSDSALIVGNYVFYNHEYGIQLHVGADSNIVYDNELGDNTLGNGYGYKSSNRWDDGVSTGNWWKDYTTGVVYYVPGPGNNVDRYPTGPTNIVDHSDVSVQRGQPNAFIQWIAYSKYPDSYVLYVNGIVRESSSWDGKAINVIVDTSNLGTFNYTLFVNDTMGCSDVDTVLVTVFDSPPSIDHPYDRCYNFDTYEPPIVWHPSDPTPDSFVVYRNSSVVSSGSWDGGSISVDIVGLDIGTYVFTLWVYDTYGNSASDEVVVCVVDFSPWISSPDWFAYEIGTTGHTITWNGTDVNPNSYRLFRNGTMIDSGPWYGGTLTFSVDGLGLGLHNYTLELLDTGGNRAASTVMVMVCPHPPGPDTSGQPTDWVWDPLAVALLLGTGMAGIVAALVILSRRGPQ
ncbi:MAG: right-handed parallel beta-helix repeat-containing protein [Candidatus Thorarchaeota archaeon]